MSNLRFAILFAVIVLFIGQASAGQYSVNGTTYDTTWDGRVIPSSQIVYGSNDDTILVQELLPATAFTVGNDTIYLNNNFSSFKREKFKISPILTYPKATLLNKMVSVNSTTAYLNFPYSLSRVKDFISNNEIRLGNWAFKAGLDHIDVYDDNQTQTVLSKSFYDFKIVNDEIRVYFLKSEANKLQGNITFEMNSWTINGSTTPQFINSTLVNLTINQGTNNLELKQQVDDYISYWRADGNAKDNNRTSANDGTLNGGMGYTSGKYGSAFQFDGVNDYVNAGNGGSLNLNSITLTMWVKQNSLTGTDALIISKDASGTPSYEDGFFVRYGYGSDIAAGKIDFGYYNSSAYVTLITDTAVILDTNFHFISITKNSTHNTNIYVDGINVKTGTLNGNPKTGNYNLYIGRGANPNYLSGRYFNGSIDEVRIYNRDLTNNEINLTMNQSKYSSGYIKSWYNTTNANITTSLIANGSTDANSNGSLQIVTNASSPSGFISPSNQSLNASWAFTGFQNTDSYLWLFGNGTSTPQVSNITFYDQTVSGGATTYNISGYVNNSSGAALESVSVVNGTNSTTTNATGYYTLTMGNGTYNFTYSKSGYVTGYKEIAISGADVSNQNVTLQFDNHIPPTPINLANTTGNFWINHTWQAGSGNIKNSYNVSQNGTWTNGSSVTFMNSSVGAHGWSNISVYAYNSSGNGTLNQTPASMNTQVPNNVPILNSVGNHAGMEGNNISFAISGTDADSDSLSCSTNLPYDSISNCVYVWISNYTASGNYSGNITIQDSYGGSDYETVWVNVSNYSGSIVNVTVSKATVNVSENFFINITVDPQGGNIIGMQSNLEFDETMIRVNNVSEGNLFNQNGAVTAFSSGTINNNTGLIENTWTVITDAGKAVNQSGTFVIINATAIAVGQSGLNLVNLTISNVIIADPVSQSVPFNLTNGSIIVKGASLITVPANSWGIFNNWSTYNTTFSQIAANESNDITYTFYNTTSGEWESYYIGYTYGANNPIGQHNSVLGFFSAQTTITANTVTPSTMDLTTGWNMLYVEGTSNRTLTTIETNIETSPCTVSAIYSFNLTTQDYVSTGTENVQPNQGFLAYIDSDCTWTRTTI